MNVHERPIKCKDFFGFLVEKAGLRCLFFCNLSEYKAFGHEEILRIFFVKMVKIGISGFCAYWGGAGFVWLLFLGGVYQADCDGAFGQVDGIVDI